jgi:predicted nucleic acid-binding protein
MSGTDKPKIYYWDACDYLAWLKDEQKAHGTDCIEALRRVAKESFEKKSVIITSTITFVEVLSSTLSGEKERQFRQSFRHQDHISYDVDPPIAMKARDIRVKFLNHPSKRKLSTPDAIHLATAMIYKADEFWTLDDGKKNPKYLGLLELDGHEWLDNLVIRRPTIENPELPFQA